MQVLFGDPHLEALFMTGHSRKGKLPAGLVRKFCQRVQILEAAESIHDLQHSASLHFKRLQGHENRFSLRINDQYRLEFEIEFEDKARTRGTVSIVKLSAHYAIPDELSRFSVSFFNRNSIKASAGERRLGERVAPGGFTPPGGRGSRPLPLSMGCGGSCGMEEQNGRK